MTRRALITGGAGFIAGHLARALAEDGWAVDLLDNFARGRDDLDLNALLSFPATRIIRVSMTDREAIGQCDTGYDVIFHFAAIIGVRHVLNRPFAVLRDNVEMTVNAIEMARRQTALSRFVFASTSEVTAGALAHMNAAIPTPEDIPLVLTDLGHPRTSYMLSKIYGEALCHQSGIPFTIVRPHNVYGPRMGMAHVVPELLKRVHDTPTGGGQLEVASVDHRRAFCFVDDAVAQMHGLIDTGAATGGTFNIGNAAAEIRIGALAEQVVRTVGRTDIEIVPLPPTAGSPERRCPDMTLTRDITGISPSVDLADGVARTYDWYRQQADFGAEKELEA